MKRLLNWLQTRRRTLLWACAALSLYALLGFLFLPWFAGRQLTDLLERRLALDLQMEALRFNPFSFTLEAGQLQLHASDGPLLDLERLYVNLEPWRLLLLEVRVGDVEIDSPQVYINRYTSTDNTFSRLARQWRETADPDDSTVVVEEEAGAEPFPLEVLRFQYNNGSIHYRDEVPETTFQTTLGPINTGVDHLSLQEAEEDGNKRLVMQLEEGGTLTWISTFSVTPLQLSGQLTVDGFSLGIPYRYFADSLPFVLQSGDLALTLDYSLSLPSGPRLELSNLAVRISDFTAVDTVTGASLLSDADLALEGGSFAYPELAAQAEALRINALQFNLQRNQAGELNWLAMLAGLPRAGTDPAAQPAPAPDRPVQLRIGEASIGNTQVTYLDQSLQTPAAITLQTEARLQDFSLAPDTRMPFTSRVQPTSGGSIDVEGELQLLPDLNLDARLEVTELALQPAQAWLDEVAQVDIDSGNLSLRARVQSTAGEPFSWQGAASIAGLQLTDRQREETLLSLAAMQLETVEFALGGRSLAISELGIDGLFARVLIDEDGQSNIARALVAAGDQDSTLAADTEAEADVDQAARTADTVAEGSAFDFSLGRLQLVNAGSDFTDRSLPIVFDTQMRDLQGEISGFSTQSNEAMAVSLEGQVGAFGLAEISGALNPLDMARQTNIRLAFNNLELPAMTPYVIKFAGREIAEGRVDVELVYTIDDSALDASNVVIIRDMRLGERVEYPDAMSLPLDLAVALLKNGEGVIDLRVPVTGNVNDPQFSFGPVIRQAIVNVLTGIVAAPFRLLGALVGGDAEDLENIRFRPGRSDLAPPEQEKLQKLLGALVQRPQLALELPAPYAMAEDTLALQIDAVDARIETRLAEDASEEQLLQRRQRVLELLYVESALMPTLEMLQAQFTLAPETAADGGQDNEDLRTADGGEEPPVSEPPVFDALAYSAHLRERLIAAEAVSTGQLQTLAMARQTAIAGHLLAEGTLSADRLVLQVPDAVQMEDDNWLAAGFDVSVVE